MRKWYKYLFETSSAKTGLEFVPRSQNFAEFSDEMGGYVADEATYANKVAFFNAWYYEYHQGRLVNYDGFLRQYLPVSAQILSVASGRCANELRLLEDGYAITCSDLAFADMHILTQNLFPEFRFETLDILKTSSKVEYDAVIALSLIYLFDDVALKRFFANVVASLKNDGLFILDSAGSPDNWLSFLLHDGWLRWEAYLLYFLKRLKRKFFPKPDHQKIVLTVKHQGYRRTNQEIFDCAQGFGLRLIAQADYAFLVEFNRSFFFSQLISRISLLRKLCELMGRAIPYTRMFCFKKII